MTVEQPHFVLESVRRISPAWGPRFLPDGLRVAIGRLFPAVEVRTEVPGLTLGDARERGAQLQREPATKSVRIVLDE